MKIEIYTIFPDLVEHYVRASLLGRAIDGGRVEIGAIDLREFAPGRHRQVDDAVFGGGPGMVMKPDVVAAALDATHADSAGLNGRRIVVTPAGRRLSQSLLDELAGEHTLTLLCGRYEGIDERVIESYDFEPVSIGDYVIGGGELAALVIVEGVVRLLPGVMGNELSATTESFRGALLEAPSYTRPAEWRGMRIPDVLLSGDHAAVARWRRRRAIALTAQRRPDLLEQAAADGHVTESEITDACAADTIESRFPEETP